METTASLTGLLVEAGLRNRPLDEVVDAFGRGLNDQGLPVARIFVGTNTLHPLVRVRSLIWDRMAGPTTRFEFRHPEIDAPMLRQSPFAAMLRDGLTERRLDLGAAPIEGEEPVFAELRAAGMTEWLGCVFPFGELAPQVGGPSGAERLGELWLVCSFATDRPGGYAVQHLATLRAVLPTFALAAKATTLPLVGQGLLAAYLGDDPAARVLAGEVTRGEVKVVEAVLFYADLRGFTAVADRLSGGALIGLLDDSFDCMVRPVTSRGGEILKFLGDGLLGIFRMDGRDRGAVCARALDAAVEALALMRALEARRSAAGEATPGLDIALHVGDVQYGNVGAEARLDFTVVGPAVNEAARIELLCKELDVSLLVSAAFGAAAGGAGARLVPLGRHRLRGVRHEAELFGLRP